MDAKSRRWLIFISSVIIIVVVMIAINPDSDDKRSKEFSESSGYDEHAGQSAQYVGRQNCVKCHQREHDLWQGSDHDMAMMPASDSTVLGDFNNASFTHFGITSQFYRRNGRFFARTEGQDGEMTEFEVSFTFGVRPLQQYLVKFPDGRMQVLPLCWDTRPEKSGGQRWFHIYPDERIAPDDVLFWTRLNQNWNYMCAECHSTNLRKNYHTKTNTYTTAYSEIDVSCEACHGPGSVHVGWAEEYEKKGKPAEKGNMGLMVRFKTADAGRWIFTDKSPTAQRTAPLGNDNLVEMCARCHSRRTELTDDYYFGRPLLTTHRITLLEEGMYFPDGQILEEVYVYDSFLQSKMYNSGVICSDCHESHSMKVYAQDNTLCYRCHLHDTYGTKQHHFHDPQKAGASCVDCHMPERKYMVVDPRRDHSIRIPRPDLSVKYGTPNACNQCHSDKSPEWASDYVTRWYGKDFSERAHFASQFFSARKGDPQAKNGLLRLIYDEEQPDIVRASALLELRRFPGQDILPALTAMTRSEKRLIRFAAVQASEMVEINERWQLIKHLLQDPIATIRMEAANRLSSIPRQQLTGSDRIALDEATQEYIASQLFNAERPESHLNLGILHVNNMDFDAAEAEYKKAIKLEPGMPYSYINLADLYRIQDRDDLGEIILNEGISRIANHPDLYHSLALLQVRQKRMNDALITMKKSFDLDQSNPGNSYLYAIALNSAGQTESALGILVKAQQQNPFNRPILEALVTINHENGNREPAIKYARELIHLYPDNRGYNQLMRQLQPGTN